MTPDPDHDNIIRLHPSPFRPGYGERPEVLVGRDDLLHSIHRGLLTSVSHQLALYSPPAAPRVSSRRVGGVQGRRSRWRSHAARRP